MRRLKPSISGALAVTAIVIWLINIVYAFTFGKKAEGNYWGEGATTLEWTVSSPPPFHSYDELPHIAPEAGHG